MGSGSRLFGSSGHRPAATLKATPARFELGRAGVTALLWLGVLRLFDGFGMSDLARQAFVTV